MKKLLFAFCTLSLAYTANCQTLFTYGNNKVSKDEFLRAYNKNQQPNADKQKAIQEYLDLYINFKLKVLAARESGLDTLPQIKYDVENFKRQIAENYIGDEQVLKKIEIEAWQRSRRDLHVQHFFVPVAADAKPEDTVKAMQAAKEIENALKAGNSDYSALVNNATQKYAPARTKDFGYITVFTLPYQYENIVYNTPTGSTSTAFRSANGWHIFKILGERKNPGRWKVAQILLSLDPNASPEAKQATKERAMAIYNHLVAGQTTFNLAVKNFSNDRLTAASDGLMPDFTTGTYSPAFENEVFKIKKDGDYTAPFETALGFHIVKRIIVAPVPDTFDSGYMYDAKQKILSSGRMDAEKDRFAKWTISKTGAKRNPAVKDAELIKYADSVLINGNNKNYAFSDKPIVLFPKKPVTGSDWLTFIASNYRNKSLSTADFKTLWAKFFTNSSLNYYRNNLEDYNDAFKYQLWEFQEGNMLFDIMDKKVWNKAGEDNDGLKKLYAERKNKYKWENSSDVVIYNCPNATIANQIPASVNSGKTWKEIVSESNNLIQADSGRYELDQITEHKSAAKPQSGLFSDVYTTTEGTAIIVQYVKIYAAGEQRSFADARGLVINDYQNVLEQQWLSELRKKYPVKVNSAVLATLFK